MMQGHPPCRRPQPGKYGERYPDADKFLERLDAWEKKLGPIQPWIEKAGPDQEDILRELVELRKKALIDSLPEQGFR